MRCNVAYTTAKNLFIFYVFVTFYTDEQTIKNLGSLLNKEEENKAQKQKQFFRPSHDKIIYILINIYFYLHTHIYIYKRLGFGTKRSYTNWSFSINFCCQNIEMCFQRPKLIAKSTVRIQTTHARSQLYNYNKMQMKQSNIIIYMYTYLPSEIINLVKDNISYIYCECQKILISVQSKFKVKSVG